MGQMLAEQSEPVRVLQYGEGGAGKTSALLGMARMGKVLVFNAEKGVKARALKKLGIPISNIEVFPEEGGKLTFDNMQAEIERVADALEKDPTAYIGVLWDSATEILQALLDIAVYEGYLKAQRLNKPRDRAFVDVADYGTVTTQLRLLIRQCMDLPCHLGISALAKREQDDDGTVKYVIAVTPAFRKDLIGYMDLIGFSDTILIDGEDHYRSLFAPRGKYYGKDRLNAVPARMYDPSFDRIVAYVEEDIDEETDPIMGAIRRHAEKLAAEQNTATSAETTTPATKE